ncbi:MAG: hypothetical protein IT580_03380, partial [Verrucomicrobiales bacterium]|nr:hypothetical protein [Verrucomicrobiales bacterium]
MTLLVFHHHYRPGGVRRVIELGLPGIVGRAGLSIDTVWLVGGEAPEAAWLERLQSALRPVQVEVRVDAALGYASEQRSRSPRATADVRRVVERLAQELSGREVVVWGHNPSLARNAPATRAWVRAGERYGWRLVFHHHDWWFDNRWQRWPELKRAGLGTLADAARWI